MKLFLYFLATLGGLALFMCNFWIRCNTKCIEASFVIFGGLLFFYGLHKISHYKNK